MSDIQIGDQSSKPQDLEKTEMVLNAVIESEVKKGLSSLKGLEKMTKGIGGSEFFGGGGGGGSAFLGGGGQNMDHDSTPTSLFVAAPAKKARAKGSVSLQQWRATKDSFTGAQRSRHEIKSRERVAESAFAGRMKSKCAKYSTGSAKDLVEDCNALKAKWAWLPKGLVANKDMLSAFGFGHLKEAHDAIQAEKVKPALQAVISGTANDMEKYAASFKGVDEGVKETVYANASSTMKQKLNPLMSQ